MFRTFLIALALTAFLIGCGSRSAIEAVDTVQLKTNPAKSDNVTPGKNALILKTTMTDKGVECPAVQGMDQQLYTIADMPADFKKGDRLNIHLIDTVEPMASFCQQGQTIAWTRIELIAPDGAVIKY